MYSSVVGSAIIDYHVKDDNGTGVLTAEAFRRAALRLRQQQTPAGLLATLTYISLYLTTNFKYIIQKIRINKTLVSYKLIRFNFKGAVPIHRDMASRSEGFVKCFLICWVSLECSYLIYYASGFGCLRKRHPQTV